MAIAATLLGGIFGFLSFVAALILGYGFMSAGAIYLTVGMGFAVLTVGFTLLKPRTIEAEAHTA